ncbi:MFS transporter [Microbacterium sp. SA39]|uniref:MFS transporter n=1 Tax=Microbacterium sp. SA39 TaxID=1263625 RepID=UPI0005FA6BFA|nr:MFS transporter [Microbacterium sp. SA39]KJQ55476.1 putative metabolite transport protein CsbC [Microbacterium sp. SA39]
MKLGSKSTTGWRATIAVAMSNYIEAGSIIAIATSLGFWQAELGFGDLTAGLLAAFSANAFGAAIGAMLGGPLSDKLGRKFIYTYDLVVFMVGILLAAFAVNVPMLFLGFILTGIAVGAGVPASWTYIAEQAPTKDRAKHVGTAQLAWSFGPLVGFALAALLAPLELFGSRMIFIHLFIVAAIVWWVRQGLPESQLWKDEKASQGRRDAAPSRTGRGFGALLSKRVNLKALLFLFGIYGFWGVVAGQAGIFMPRVYAAAGVESVVEQSLLQVLVWGCTVIATYFGFMLLADRMSRRLLYIIGAALGILGWIVLVFGEPGTGTLVTFAVTWGLSCGIGAQAFYGLWASELFATPYRASAQGLLFFAARLAIGFLSYFFPVLLTAVGVPNVGLIMVAFLTVALLVGAIWAPRTQGKSLQEIEEERYGMRVSAPTGTATR